jgi:Sulfotransferase family
MEPLSQCLAYLRAGRSNGARGQSRAMAKNPAIVLDDLHAPVLSDIQKGALAYADANPVSLDAASILSAAVIETGLTDFGADDFRPRLDIWLQAIDEDANLTALGRKTLFDMTVRFAATRLRIEDMVRRHPEILDIVIDRPIIVAGLPRSGTTHMLGLLSADPRLRSLPWWEANAPVPTDADAPTANDPNPRWTRSQAGWEAYQGLLPHMKIMHEFSPDHVSEDIELQALDFSSYLIEWLAYVPRWRDYYLGQDQTGTYRYLKKAMQVLTFLNGPNRWVIKCPQHMEQLPVLRAVFPDATTVITHRDPVGSIRSAMTMALYAARVFRKQVLASEPRDYWIDRYERLLRRCVKDRDCLPDAQTIDVYFHEWIANPDPILKAIYAKADLVLSDETLRDLKTYHAAHDPGHQGKIAYDLEGHFGVTASDIRKRFDFYFTRFPVQIEIA